MPQLHEGKPRKGTLIYQTNLSSLASPCVGHTGPQTAGGGSPGQEGRGADLGLGVQAFHPPHGARRQPRRLAVRRQRRPRVRRDAVRGWGGGGVAAVLPKVTNEEATAWERVQVVCDPNPPGGGIALGQSGLAEDAGTV